MTLPVKLGGTGGTDKASARAGLGLKEAATKTLFDIATEGEVADALNTKAGKGANTDITSIGGLLTPLSQAQGGTGAGALTAGNVNVNGNVQNLGTVLNNLASSIQQGLVIRQTWAEIDAIPTTANISYQVSGNDTGTHAGQPGELGYNATTGQVPNSGTFSAYGNPLTKRRVSAGNGITTVSPLSAAPTLQLAFRDPATNQFTVLTAADSASFIQEISMPTLYPKEPSEVIEVTDTSTVILAADDARRGDISIQIVDGAGDVALNFLNQPAVFGDSHAWEQKGPQFINHPNPGRQAVSAVARGKNGTAYISPIQLRVRVNRTDNLDLPSRIADNLFSRWTDPVDQRYKDVVRTEIDYLQRQGVYQALTMWFMPGASKNNSTINMANPTASPFVYHSTVGFVPYTSVTGNGFDSYIDTLVAPSTGGMTIGNQFMAARYATTTATSSGVAAIGNSSTFYLEPNRGAQLYGFRSGASTETNSDALRPLGLWAAMNRRGDETNLTGYIDGLQVFNRPRAMTALVERSFTLLAANASGTPSLFSALPLAGAAVGPGLQPISIGRFNDSCKRIEAVAATIASGG